MSTWNSMMRLYVNVIRTGASNLEEIASVYGPRISKRREQLRDIAKVGGERVLRSEAAQKLRVACVYCKAELGPPSGNEIQRLKDDIVLVAKFMKSNCWKSLTVSQAWLLFLVGWEISLWFYVGECIGKFRIVGYSV